MLPRSELAERRSIGFWLTRAVASPPRRNWQVPYNGFSWAERCAATPIQNAALRTGQLIRPTVCCICGDDRSAHPQGRDYRFLHTEDYRKPLLIHPVCKTHHAALHARFDDPDRWERVINRYGSPNSWFLALSLDPASQWQPFEQTYPHGVPSAPSDPRISLR